MYCLPLKVVKDMLNFELKEALIKYINILFQYCNSRNFLKEKKWNEPAHE